MRQPGPRVQVDDLDLKRRYSPYVEQCVVLLKDGDVSAELFVEVLGCLANLNLPEFDFGVLVRRHDLLNFLSQFAVPDAVDDDILLEVVMFIGAPAATPRLITSRSCSPRTPNRVCTGSAVSMDVGSLCGCLPRIRGDDAGEKAWSHLRSSCLFLASSDYSDRR